MEEKTRFTVITKILGICSILFSVIGFYVLLMYSENISLAIWNMIYMIFIPMGGFFNLLDFGTTSYSKAACFSYALALILRLLFDITIAEEFHWDFLLMLTFALFVSVLRCHSVLKTGKSNANSAISNNAEAAPKIGAWQSNPSEKTKPREGGYLAGIIGVILFLIGMGILGVKLRFFVFIAPIN